MWLVLCEPEDAAAVWVAASLRARGYPVEIVGADELGNALRWEVRAQDGVETVQIELADGRRLLSDQLSGVLNRLGHVPRSQLRRAGEEDAAYVEAELAALHLTWLHFLPCPVLNRPRPGGLSGVQRPPIQWAHLAVQAGFAPADPGLSPGAPIASTRVIVVDETVTGSFVPPAVARAAVELRSLSGERILGLDLQHATGDAVSVVAADPVPDLRVGGSALIDAVVSAFHRAPHVESAAGPVWRPWVGSGIGVGS
jgi:hypothetical protein